RAAAPGVVRAMRDGMPDIPFTDPDAPDLTDRSCGNAVIIDHAGGWQTRYCHLRRDSVLVRSGDSVAAGTPIGQVGLSGKTEFEHLHVSVHHDGQVVDPFQPGEAATCGETGETLWSVPVPYLPGGLIAAGFAAEVPEFRQIKSGTAHRDSLPATAPALVLWGHMFGSRPGDLLRFDITGETGTVLSRTFQLDRTQARLFRATGRKRGAAPWTAGPYTGIVRLIRNGQEIDRQTNTVTIRD
ncbi:MAG: M23 family metallopeptidase, partial [Rhodobacter sp.]|nr:M23 family metallopeptidase [Rhodobacter sp.]